MAKVALLIGISEYGEGLTNLPGTQADLQAMQRVLQSPQIGGFDTVDLLPNPTRTQMELAIEKLFSDDRTRDDLILLYFSGHGVRDDNGTLYFATCNTEKSPQGRIRTSTAVPANALQNYMSQSRSKRQVVILDCCFSGAFANDMKAKGDEAIDVKAQLGSEGRAVLTSSTATQVSFEEKGASIYTRYLVQGLETGAADRDENGQITVDELHEYAREKVQEAAPTMQPEIYAVREGYKILIARAPQGDPKLVFRKELDARAKLKRGKLSPIEQRAFKIRGQQLGVSVPEMEQITNEILQPYREFWAKLEEFEQAVKETLEYESQLSTTSIDDLQYLQGVLNLRDEDIASILDTYQLDLNATDDLSSEEQSFPPQPSPFVPDGLPLATLIEFEDNQSFDEEIDATRFLKVISDIGAESSHPTVSDADISQRLRLDKQGVQDCLDWLEEKGYVNLEKSYAGYRAELNIRGRAELRKRSIINTNSQVDSYSDHLESEKGIDYTKLRDLLKAGKWKEADKETADRMMETIGKASQWEVESKDLLNFPCKDLKTIDRLWVKYSKGKFGFSAQKKIYVECGAKLDGQYPDGEIWWEFCDRLGWRKNAQYVDYCNLKFNPFISSTGELPVPAVDLGGVCGAWEGFGGGVLFSRTETCKL